MLPFGWPSYYIMIAVTLVSPSHTHTLNSNLKPNLNSDSRAFRSLDFKAGCCINSSSSGSIATIQLFLILWPIANLHRPNSAISAISTISAQCSATDASPLHTQTDNLWLNWKKKCRPDWTAPSERPQVICGVIPFKCLPTFERELNHCI